MTHTHNKRTTTNNPSIRGPFRSQTLRIKALFTLLFDSLHFSYCIQASCSKRVLVCVQHLTWPQIDRRTSVGVLAPRLLVLPTLHKLFFHLEYSIFQAFMVVCYLMIIHSWFIRFILVLIEVMIGACFPRYKFIALKSLVVFGLNVSIAFPAINSSPWNRSLFLVWMFREISDWRLLSPQ